MIRRLFRFALKLGVVGSVVAVAVKAFDRRRSASSAPDWSAGTEPWPPLDVSDATAAAPLPSEPGAEPTAAADPAAEAAAAEVVEAHVVEAHVVEAEVAGDVVAEAEVVDAEVIAGGDGGSQVWSGPNDDGSCPSSHPVKAKLASGVFHLPGMANYERTKADRCYPDAEAAQADNLRQAKR